MPTWGTVLSPDQLDDLVALISSWREGTAVVPSFSATDLIARAIFALDQGDPSSAKLHIQHALEVVTGAGAEVLKNAAAQIDAGDLEGAGETLKALQAQWPMGDPASGAVVYSANCAPCHGLQGEGGIGKPLNNNAWLAGQTNAQLVEFVLTGRPGTAMAGFKGRLEETQIADVIAFLRLWQK
jgi:mono/diheme cytochrome c family protein